MTGGPQPGRGRHLIGRLISSVAATVVVLASLSVACGSTPTETARRTPAPADATPAATDELQIVRDEIRVFRSLSSFRLRRALDGLTEVSCDMLGGHKEAVSEEHDSPELQGVTVRMLASAIQESFEVNDREAGWLIGYVVQTSCPQHVEMLHAAEL